MSNNIFYLKNYVKRLNNLAILINNFKVLNFSPIIGIEWEFYLLQNNKSLSDKQLQIFRQNLLNKNINILEIAREQGNGQIEIKFPPYSNIPNLCQDFIQIKKYIREIALEMSLEADFSAQKYLNDCGSSLQINLTLLNHKKENLFHGSSNDESKILLYTINGILNNIPKFLDNYISSKEDLIRFDRKLNIKLHKSGKYTAPINISWGYDNRTAAIRIVGKDNNRRLEFRVPSSNSYIIKVIESLLESVFLGIKTKTIPQNPDYGNLFDNLEYIDLALMSKL
jgi:glutamine synthetase